MANNDLSCMAQTKLTVNQSALLDEMARTNSTTRSYELRMILELYGRERLHIEDDRKELIEAEKCCMSLYEVYKEVYPVKEGIHSLPWYTGIQIVGLGIVGLLELEMVNKHCRGILFRYTDKQKPSIAKRYPEIASILEKIIDLTRDNIVTLERFK